MMRRVVLSRGRRLAYSALWWSVVALLAWLDSDGCAWSLRHTVPIQTASFFAIVWSGIEALASVLATAAEVTAAYLATALSWLASRVSSFLLSSGAMFARVWDAVKIVWTDAVKPALLWINDHLRRLQAWLSDTFRPVFDFLRAVRQQLLDFYSKFIRPITDTIDFLRQLSRVLDSFHIHLLDGLDRTLQQIEQRIEEPFLWVYQRLTEIWNVLDRVVTLDGYFQRLTLIRSMARYAPDWMNGFWNAQIAKGAQHGDAYSRGRDYPLDAAEANGKELTQFFRGEGSRMDATIAGLVPIWRIAAGIDPPQGD